MKCAESLERHEAFCRGRGRSLQTIASLALQGYAPEAPGEQQESYRLRLNAPSGLRRIRQGNCQFALKSDRYCDQEVAVKPYDKSLARGRDAVQAVVSSELGQASSRNRRWGDFLTGRTLVQIVKELTRATIWPSGVIRAGMY
jgi:hypothetical protein